MYRKTKKDLSFWKLPLQKLVILERLNIHLLNLT